jgi:hypothetical protein
MEELLRTLSRVLSTHIFPYAAAVAAPFLSWSSVLGLAALLLGYYGLRAAGGGAAGGAAAAVAGAAAGHRAGPAAHAAAGGHAPDDGVQAALFARAQVPAPPCGGQAGRGSVSVSYNAPACSYPCVSFPIPRPPPTLRSGPARTRMRYHALVMSRLAGPPTRPATGL